MVCPVFEIHSWLYSRGTIGLGLDESIYKLTLAIGRHIQGVSKKRGQNRLCQKKGGTFSVQKKGGKPGRRLNFAISHQQLLLVSQGPYATQCEIPIELFLNLSF